MAPMAQRSLLCPLAPSGMIPLAHGDDLAKVSTCVPPLTQTTLGAVSRTLQSRMGLRGSVTNTSPHPTAFSVFLPWTTHSNIHRHGPVFPPSSAQGHSGLSLVWACLVVLEVEPWSLSMLGKCYTTELPCLLMTLIHGCLPPFQSAPTAGGHGTEYRALQLFF